MIVLAAAIVMAIFAPHIARYDPIAQDTNALLAPPSGAHPLGTDFLGRDTFSRLVFGARASLAVAFSATAIALVCGLIVGLAAGYNGGWIDGVLMRTMDGLLAFPALVLALAITASLGPNARNATIAIGVTGIPAFARLVRGQVLATKNLDFVAAANALGASGFRIVTRHILPNISAPVIVQTSLAVPAAIIAEAVLGFLGLGVQPPTPSWGNIISDGQTHYLNAPWLVLCPGIALMLTVVSFNLVGDGLRDVLYSGSGRR